jgi:predicted transcriptional regulator
MPEKDPESVALNLRVPVALRDRLDALAERLPMFSRHKLAVLALAQGVAIVEADPHVLLAGVRPSKRAKR